MSHPTARSSAVGETYRLVAGLPVQIDAYSVEPLSGALSDRTRHSTVIHLLGGGEEGLGEDASPVEADQLTFQQADPALPLAGDWTIDSFSSHLGTLDLFPEPPMDDRLRSFRRWAFESAALDLALRQAGRSLAGALELIPRPLRFVNSMRLVDPPSFDPIRDRLELFPGLRFKLDATSAWDDALIEQIAATGAVDTVDLKGAYPPPHGQPADPDLYERIVRGFPDAWIEDPGITPETLKVLEPHLSRVTWDGVLHSIADIERLPAKPPAINIKPVRFGSIHTLFGVYDYCAANDIAMYGGGFGELGVGRHQLQYLASMFHPDTPNDVAPSAYNRPRLDPDVPTSPLTVVPAATGFRTD